MIEIDLRPEELVIDYFAGGGGASEGMEEALGRPVDIAVNHDREALGMHAANHPRTRHILDDVWSADIRKECGGRQVGVAWFSPDCTHFSKARGSKPRKKEIRGLAWVVFRVIRSLMPNPPRCIFLENVEEFEDYGPLTEDNKPDKRRKGMLFKRFVTMLRKFGYTVDWRRLRANKFGAGTIRQRLFLVARLDVKVIPWPAETHGPGLKPYRMAAEFMDFSLPTPSIFLSKTEAREMRVVRPLADKSLQRIAKGIKKFVFDNPHPFIVGLTHNTGERVDSIFDPMRTITGAHRGELALVSPFMGVYYGSNRDGGDRVGSVEEPLRTISTENRFALVSPFFGVYYGNDEHGASVAESIPTIPSKDRFSVVAAFLSRQFGQSIGSRADEPVGAITGGGMGHTSLSVVHLAQHNSERGGVKAGRSVTDPMATITSTGGQIQLVTSHLMKMYGTNIGSAMDAPIHTISSQGNHHAEVRTFLRRYLGKESAEFTVEMFGIRWCIADIGIRMISPRELFLCQGFRSDYVIDGGVDLTYKHGRRWIPMSKTAQVRMVGNSVSPHPASAIVRANFHRAPMIQSRAVA